MTNYFYLDMNTTTREVYLNDEVIDIEVAEWLWFDGMVDDCSPSFQELADQDFNLDYLFDRRSKRDLVTS